MDAEQRMAEPDLAPLRLLSEAGGRLFWNEEGVRTPACAIFLRCQFRGGCKFAPSRLSENDGQRGGLQHRPQKGIFQTTGNRCAFEQQYARVSGAEARWPFDHVFPAADSEG